MIEFNSNSNDHLSALLFGGTLSEKVVEPVLDELGNPVLIKSGNSKGCVKTHTVKIDVRIKGMCDYFDLKGLENKKKGFYQTNEAVLVRIQKECFGDIKEVSEVLLKIRGLRKLISTYYDGVEELCHEDGRVHPTFNHTSTETGRLSCNKPNVQNVPR